MVNVLGDSIGAGVVQQLSRKDLERLDAKTDTKHLHKYYENTDSTVSETSSDEASSPGTSYLYSSI